MRMRVVFPLVAGALLAAPAVSSAAFIHVVLPGESLSSVAAVDGLTVTQLAAANGLSPSAQLITGSSLVIPPQGTAVVFSVSPAVSTGVAGTSPAAPAGDGDNDSDDPPTATFVATTTSASSSSGGSYVVQPGDTLTAIAARAGLSTSSLAAANGLDVNGVLLSGTVLSLSGTAALVSSANPAVSQPVGAAAEGSPTAPPFPTPERLSASQIGSIASANGVSPSLAAAIAWQESGFNNDVVSSADARGVMQILPGTWSWIQNNLVAGGSPLAPASAVDNVRGGVLLLHSLLGATGGDPGLAAAGYFQGLPSVRAHGMFPATQHYVQNILALRAQFGSG